MELLAPAGNIEKLHYAYAYGADAAYIGLKQFSLRTRADNFQEDAWEAVRALKGDRKLYGALNIIFHDRDLRALEEQLDVISRYPFDAFIVSDIGTVPLLRKHFPQVELHLSTQASCLNSEAARLYMDIGFSRIIPGREASLLDLAEMKQRLPEVEIEVFVHGAMCLAYSGRCLLSAYMTGRSGNKGDCAHSCRWDYQVLEREREFALEERERPGEYYPIEEGEGFTTILSSRDLCMIDHLRELRDAGVDSLKIEGRMKSIYYTATVTRAYRKALDALEQGLPESSWAAYRDELHHVSHREFSTGFYFSREEIEKPSNASYTRTHLFLGTIGSPISAVDHPDEPGLANLPEGCYILEPRNQILAGTPIEFMGPDILGLEDSGFTLYTREGTEVGKIDHGNSYIIHPTVPVETGYIVRKEL